MNTKKRFITTYDLILSALFIALITVGSFIKIPVGPVPITLQLMFVLLAGQLLRPLPASLTLIIYTLSGIAGLPVFSGGGGVGYVLMPTFGYIIGFVFAAMLVSVISHKGKATPLKMLLANFSGLAFVYICGLGYSVLLSLFYFKEAVDILSLIFMGFLIFVPTDLFFCVFTVFIAKRIKPFMSKK